jgi:acetyl-CoA carboxylase carboxyl transferase subunit beta
VDCGRGGRGESEAHCIVSQNGISGRRRRRGESDADERIRDVPEDLWEACPKCREAIYRKELERNLKVCPKCGFHLRLGCHERIAITADEDSFREFEMSAAPYNPLGFPEYDEKIAGDRKATGLSEAVIIGECTIEGTPTVVAVMDMSFRGGSMGYEVGDRIARAAETARERRWPLIIFAASGGARMQESLISLMQMAKTSAALGRLDSAGLPCITVITDMTYAGVLASFTSLGDIILAEPDAARGFTGPRVIEITLRIRIPREVQTSEFQRDHGMIDAIVERKDMRSTLARLLRWCMGTRARDSVPAQTAHTEENHEQ